MNDIDSMVQATPVVNDPVVETGLIGYLKDLAARQDRGALAHLRRGLGKKPGEAMEMYRYVGRFLSDNGGAAQDRAVFLTAALFAYYTDAPKIAGNLGESMRRLSNDTESGSIENRFVALLNAEADELQHYLRQVIGLCRSHDIPVNWNELYKHILYWDGEDRWVQSKWARSFWGGGKENNHFQNTGGNDE